MSDDNNKFVDEFTKAGAYDLIQKDLNNKLDSVITTFRLKTSKKAFSPKIYESGWIGGSRGKIKTYKVSSLGKGVVGYVVNFGETTISLLKNGPNSREFYGSLGSTLGSIGAAAAIGSIIPGLGTIAGFLVGCGAAAIGSIFGQSLGEEIYDRTHNLKDGGNSDKNNYPMKGNNNNLTGGGKTGGVEFEIPKEIKNFKTLLYFNNFSGQNIIFKNKFSNINEILDVANRFIIDENYKFTSVNQVFQTILTEIYGGFIGEGVLPFVSLNFNNKALLYSIMPNYYKKTLTGNILGYLDYFLKGFVNGGFFKEDFANKWYIKQNENIEYLNSNFINLKKYIYNNKDKIQNNDLYLTVYDLGEKITNENNNFRKNSLSAFRIIGTINDDILVNNNIIIPDCSFRTESDFNLFPGYLDKGNENINVDDKEIEKTKEAIKMMKVIINTLMPQIPYFRGYFNILDIITFSIHYISTLDANAN